MKVMVTGGAGFIGSHVADALVRAGDRVIVVDDLSTGFRANLNPGAEFIECDIRDPRAADLVREERPDAICHHAAQMSVPRSLKEPMLDVDVNVRASLQLALAAAETGARFLFASTGGALYGDADVLPTPESYPAWPVSPYGAGKLAFEHYLHALRLSLGLDYVVLRYGNVFGPRQNPHGEAGVVAIFCRALVSGSYCAITGDGRQTRDYIYVDDVVAACLAALRSIREPLQRRNRTPDLGQRDFRADRRRLGLDRQACACRRQGWRAEDVGAGLAPNLNRAGLATSGLTARRPPGHRAVVPRGSRAGGSSHTGMSRLGIRILAVGALALIFAAAVATAYRLYLLQPHASLATG